MARQCAEATLKCLDAPVSPQESLWNSKGVIDLRRASQINANWRGLRGEMTSYAGIVRTEAGLRDLLGLIQQRRNIVENYYWQHVITRDLIELRNICLIAQLITKAALDRSDSIGGHFREDTSFNKENSYEKI